MAAVPEFLSKLAKSLNKNSEHLAGLLTLIANVSSNSTAPGPGGVDRLMQELQVQSRAGSPKSPAPSSFKPGHSAATQLADLADAAGEDLSSWLHDGAFAAHPELVGQFLQALRLGRDEAAVLQLLVARHGRAWEHLAAGGQAGGPAALGAASDLSLKTALQEAAGVPNAAGSSGNDGLGLSGTAGPVLVGSTARHASWALFCVLRAMTIASPSMAPADGSTASAGLSAATEPSLNLLDSCQLLGACITAVAHNVLLIVAEQRRKASATGKKAEPGLYGEPPAPVLVSPASLLHVLRSVVGPEGLNISAAGLDAPLLHVGAVMQFLSSSTDGSTSLDGAGAVDQSGVGGTAAPVIPELLLGSAGDTLGLLLAALSVESDDGTAGAADGPVAKVAKTSSNSSGGSASAKKAAVVPQLAVQAAAADAAAAAGNWLGSSGSISINDRPQLNLRWLVRSYVQILKACGPSHEGGSGMAMDGVADATTAGGAPAMDADGPSSLDSDGTDGSDKPSPVAILQAIWSPLVDAWAVYAGPDYPKTILGRDLSSAWQQAIEQILGKASSSGKGAGLGKAGSIEGGAGFAEQAPHTPPRSKPTASSGAAVGRPGGGPGSVPSSRMSSPPQPPGPVPHRLAVGYGYGVPPTPARPGVRLGHVPTAASGGGTSLAGLAGLRGGAGIAYTPVRLSQPSTWSSPVRPSQSPGHPSAHGYSGSAGQGMFQSPLALRHARLGGAAGMPAGPTGKAWSGWPVAAGSGVGPSVTDTPGTRHALASLMWLRRAVEPLSEGMPLALRQLCTVVDNARDAHSGQTHAAATNGTGGEDGSTSGRTQSFVEGRLAAVIARTWSAPPTVSTSGASVAVGAAAGAVPPTPTAGAAGTPSAGLPLVAPPQPSSTRKRTRAAADAEAAEAEGRDPRVPQPLPDDLPYRSHVTSVVCKLFYRLLGGVIGHEADGTSLRAAVLAGHGQDAAASGTASASAAAPASNPAVAKAVYALVSNGPFLDSLAVLALEIVLTSHGARAWACPNLLTSTGACPYRLWRAIQAVGQALAPYEGLDADGPRVVDYAHDALAVFSALELPLQLLKHVASLEERLVEEWVWAGTAAGQQGVMAGQALKPSVWGPYLQLLDKMHSSTSTGTAGAEGHPSTAPSQPAVKPPAHALVLHKRLVAHAASRLEAICDCLGTINVGGTSKGAAASTSAPGAAASSFTVAGSDIETAAWALALSILESPTAMQALLKPGVHLDSVLLCAVYAVAKSKANRSAAGGNGTSATGTTGSTGAKSASSLIGFNALVNAYTACRRGNGALVHKVTRAIPTGSRVPGAVDATGSLTSSMAAPTATLDITEWYNTVFLPVTQQMVGQAWSTAAAVVAMAAGGAPVEGTGASQPSGSAVSSPARPGPGSGIPRAPGSIAGSPLRPTASAAGMSYGPGGLARAGSGLAGTGHRSHVFSPLKATPMSSRMSSPLRGPGPAGVAGHGGNGSGMSMGMMALGQGRVVRLAGASTGPAQAQPASATVLQFEGPGDAGAGSSSAAPGSAGLFGGPGLGTSFLSSGLLGAAGAASAGAASAAGDSTLLGQAAFSQHSSATAGATSSASGADGSQHSASGLTGAAMLADEDDHSSLSSAGLPLGQCTHAGQGMLSPARGPGTASPARGAAVTSRMDPVAALVHSGLAPPGTRLLPQSPVRVRMSIVPVQQGEGSEAAAGAGLLGRADGAGDDAETVDVSAPTGLLMAVSAVPAGAPVGSSSGGAAGLMMVDEAGQPLDQDTAALVTHELVAAVHASGGVHGGHLGDVASGMAGAGPHGATGLMDAIMSGAADDQGIATAAALASSGLGADASMGARAVYTFANRDPVLLAQELLSGTGGPRIESAEEIQMQIQAQMAAQGLARPGAAFLGRPGVAGHALLAGFGSVRRYGQAGPLVTESTTPSNAVALRLINAAVARAALHWQTRHGRTQQLGGGAGGMGAGAAGILSGQSLGSMLPTAAMAGISGSGAGVDMPGGLGHGSADMELGLLGGGVRKPLPLASFGGVLGSGPLVVGSLPPLPGPSPSASSTASGLGRPEGLPLPIPMASGAVTAPGQLSQSTVEMLLRLQAQAKYGAGAGAGGAQA